jgi:hypothetical protein
MALCMMPMMAQAQAEGYLGTWCPQGPGPMMFFEETGLGFGDHTICDWKAGPDISDTGFSGLLTCRNVYVTGENADGTVAVVETEHRRGAVVLGVVTRTDSFGARYMQVTLDGEAMDAEFGPCG